MDIDLVTGQIVDAAIRLHTALGPGLLESAYDACMRAELRDRGLEFQHQVALPVFYRGERIDVGYRMDLVVDGQVLVELKAVKEFLPIHRAQLLSYLRLSGMKVGLLLNFHVPHMRDGIRRVVNNY